MESFNRTYVGLLSLLDLAFDGSPQTLRAAFGVMAQLKIEASALLEMPTEDGLELAGPSFEYLAGS
jgi:hypothetical protein